MTPSQRLHRSQVEEGRVDAMGCIRPFYPTFTVFNVLGRRCRSGFAILPTEPPQEQPTVVLLWGRPLASWLLALGERGGHGDLHGSGRLSIIFYVHGRTELYCAQACLA
jgi:hypothetical protein